MLGIGLAICASLFLNVGKGVQKWKVRVLAAGRGVFSRGHRLDFGIWVFGILLTTVATVFYSLALKNTDKASMVSALNGVGLIGLIVFARLVLKEVVGLQKLLGAACIIGGTAALGFFDEALVGKQAFSLPHFIYASMGVVAVYAPLVVYTLKTKKAHGFVFGALAGTMIGMSMVLGDMALVEAGDDFFAQLDNPYPYVALIVGVCALALTNFAFWRSTALVVVPTTNSFIILTPLAIEFVTFGTVLQLAQYAGVVAIVFGVVLVTAGGDGAGVFEPVVER